MIRLPKLVIQGMHSNRMAQILHLDEQLQLEDFEGQLGQWAPHRSEPWHKQKHMIRQNLSSKTVLVPANIKS